MSFFTKAPVLKIISAASILLVWGCLLEKKDDVDVQEGTRTATFAARQAVAAPDSMSPEEIINMLEASGVCPRFVNLFRNMMSCDTNFCPSLESDFRDVLGCAEAAGFGDIGENSSLEEIMGRVQGFLECYCGGPAFFNAAASQIGGSGFNASQSRIGGAGL